MLTLASATGASVLEATEAAGLYFDYYLETVTACLPNQEEAAYLRGRSEGRCGPGTPGCRPPLRTSEAEPTPSWDEPLRRAWDALRQTLWGDLLRVLLAALMLHLVSQVPWARAQTTSPNNEPNMRTTHSLEPLQPCLVGMCGRRLLLMLGHACRDALP